MRLLGPFASFLLLVLMVLPASSQATFEPTCSQPNYPSATGTPIDSNVGRKEKAEPKPRRTKPRIISLRQVPIR